MPVSILYFTLARDRPSPYVETQGFSFRSVRTYLSIETPVGPFSRSVRTLIELSIHDIKADEGFTDLGVAIDIQVR